MEELPTINRGMITIIPKQPFFDWFNKLAPDMPVQLEEFKEHNGYLVSGNFVDWNIIMLQNFQDIFENELWGMWTEPDDWPSPLSWDLFQEWFSWKVSSIVFDLGKGGIQHES